MPRKSRNNLKSTFVNGYIPDQNDYCDVFDSFIHKEDDAITISLGGDVGVGTNSPAKKFHVADDAQVDGTLCAKGNVDVDGTLTANSINVPGMGMVPTGGVLMWSGSTGVFDSTGLGVGTLTGWALCNGQNSTPDLRGRFIVGLTDTNNTNYGYNNTEKNRTEYNSIGDHGGKHKYKLSSSECALPKHQHTVNDSGHTHSYLDKYSPESGDGYDVKDNDGRPISWITTASRSTTKEKADITIADREIAQAASDHENRPPFYTLAFIMKK